MEALLLYQDTPAAVSDASSILAENGFTTRSARAQEIAGAAIPPAPADLIIIFAETYKENATEKICLSVRESAPFQNAALLVVVNMYQMPLANRVKELLSADFIFTPLDPAQLRSKVDQLCKKGTP